MQPNAILCHFDTLTSLSRKKEVDYERFSGIASFKVHKIQWKAQKM